MTWKQRQNKQKRRERRELFITGAGLVLFLLLVGLAGRADFNALNF